MFGRSKTRCPLEPDVARWVERSMGWLAGRFGESILLDGRVVVPDSSFFPDPASGTVADLTPLFDRVSVYMRLDPDDIHLRFFSEGGMTDLGNGLVVMNEGPSAAGLYRDRMGKPIVSIKIGEGIGVASYIATMAHELAHVHLIGGKHVNPDRDDHEPLTDLATVFFGLGVFNANSVISDVQWADAGWSGWSIGRCGYLPEEVFGYAFAVYAWRRGESKPTWARFLRPNVRSVFKHGLRYLNAAGTCDYDPAVNTEGPTTTYPGTRMDQETPR